MAPKKYLFDANALIDIGERYYPEAVFPGLWRLFRQLLSSSGEGAVTKMVLGEIRLGSQQVQPWRTDVQKLSASHAFDESEQSIQVKFAELSSMKQKGLLPGGLSDVDLFVLSVASIHGLTIITRDGAMRRAASVLGMKTLTPTDLFKQLGWSFM